MIVGGAAMRGAPEEAPVQQPRIETEGEDFALTLPWRSFFYVALGLLMLVPLGYQLAQGYFGKALVVLGLREGPRPEDGASVVIIAFVGLVLVLFEYYALCRTVNRTRIRIGGGRVRVSHGPLPWPWERAGGAEIAACRGVGLATRKERQSALAGRGGSGIPFYRAELLLEAEGRRLALTPWLEDEGPAAAVAETVAGRLGLEVARGLRRDR